MIWNVRATHDSGKDHILKHILEHCIFRFLKVSTTVAEVNPNSSNLWPNITSFSRTIFALQVSRIQTSLCLPIPPPLYWCSPFDDYRLFIQFAAFLSCNTRSRMLDAAPVELNWTRCGILPWFTYLPSFFHARFADILSIFFNVSSYMSWHDDSTAISQWYSWCLIPPWSCRPL